MGEEAADNKTALTLSEQYLLKEKEEKPDVGSKPVEANKGVNPVNAAPEEVAAEKAEEIPAAFSEVKTDTPDGSEESTETNPASAEDSCDAAPAPSEESKETTEEENPGEEESSEEASEIKGVTWLVSSLRLHPLIFVFQPQIKQGTALHDTLSTTGA